MTRRSMLASSALAGSAAALPGLAQAASPAPSTGLHKGSGPDVAWLDPAPPAAHEGQAWGQPWPRGTKYDKSGYHLSGKDGKIPLQTWPLAWWPDGSIKWTGHATAADAALADGFAVKPGAAKGAPSLKLADGSTAITVTNGATVWSIAKSGTNFLRATSADGRTVLEDVHFHATDQDKPGDDGTGPVEAAPKLIRSTGTITGAEIEQTGPIRAVVKLFGKFTGEGGDWMPFSMRLYFHAGSASVRIVHSQIFDGDPAKRFIRGLGLSGHVPMRDELHDRHVRFGGEDGGLWGEAVRPLTGLRRDPGETFRAAQVAGMPTPPLSEMSERVRPNLQFIPAWGDFRLRQPNADGFSIIKRTAPGFGWIDVDTAGRAPGLGYVGGTTGGVAFGMHDFWQRCPTGLDINDAASDKAGFTVWYHAPDAPAMDLRFYHDVMGMEDYVDQNRGLDVTYEDYEPGWGDASGIARTMEFRLWALPATPSRDRLAQMSATMETPARLTANTMRVYEADMFGPWSPPAADGNPLREKIEARLKRELDFYVGQVDQRRWYGFWNYGDVMHSYDNDRHVWRYDIGGFAWDNSELSSDLWLWTSYLRTGRADVFRMAEAMTRHTGEVDVYHTGRFKGLGTRHGVQHWADSSKQPRISNAAYRRFYFYLAADERCGDLMRDLNDSAKALSTVIIERKVNAREGDNRMTGSIGAGNGLPEGQVMMGFGTSWGSLLAAWLTEWERTRSEWAKSMIVNGMKSIAGLKYGWLAGGAPFDLKTGRFLGAGDEISISHLSGVFGVFEITAELLTLLDVPEYEEAWLDYCAVYNLTAEKYTLPGGAPGAAGRGLRQAHSRFTAYAGVMRDDPELKRRAWAEFFGPGDRTDRDQYAEGHRVTGDAVLRPVDEIIEISTNDASQWGLTAIENLTLIGDVLRP
ncbi:exo-rhamnogalacturonan lyase family protein [Croceicoccus mobilis]|nr:Tat pathway signal sequence domain protein [Croceicoccus mobilis]